MKSFRWRSGLAATVLTLLNACGGGGGGSASTSNPPSEQAQAALSVSAPGELVAYAKKKLIASAGTGVATTGAVLVAAPAVSGNSNASTVPAFSDTLLQEAGVDEDDLVKTDGQWLYALRTSAASGATSSAAQLLVHRVDTSGVPQPHASLTLASDLSPSGMYLLSDAARMAVLGQGYSSSGSSGATGGTAIALLPSLGAKPIVTVDVVNLADAASPKISAQLRIDGSLVGSRRIGNSLVLVSRWTPVLPAFGLSVTDSADVAAAKLASLRSSDILPTVRQDGASAAPLVAETDCYVQTGNASTSLEITTITRIDLASVGLNRVSRCFAGGANAMYMSAANLYLASSRSWSYPASAGATVAVFAAGVSTDIHQFTLTSQAIDYRGTGTVDGHLGWDSQKASERMSEYLGDLRVLSFTGQSGWVGAPVALGSTVSASTSGGTASPATLTVLREDSASRSLKTLARLPNTRRPAPLGHVGEQVYGVKFLGPRAYVVTFRQSDPLYVLDLTQANDPQAVGELAMPGFSDYLWPTGPGLLLGVGKDATATGQTQGIKLALIDVADPTQPRLLASQVIGGRGSFTALDSSRHGINILQQGNVFRIALPARVYDAGAVVNGAGYQGLLRFEVDGLARTLVPKPTMPGATFSAGVSLGSAFDLARERSLLIGAQVFYFSGERWLSQTW